MKQPSSRDQQIIELRSQGLTLEAIGQRFGITKERVRQIASRYEIARRCTTQADLMARFGVAWYEISQAMKAAGLSHEPGQPRRYALSDADVAKIVEHLRKRAARKCIICGGSFEGGRISNRFCSPECFREYRRQRHASSEQGMSEKTQRIHDLLVGEPPGTLWVSFTEALRLSGMTSAKLSWLRMRGIIATKPSGKREKLYSARHCEVLRRFRAPG
jgi:hypothetical protein